MNDKSSPISIKSTSDAAAFWALPVAPVDLLFDAIDLPRSTFYAIQEEVGFRTFKLGRRVYCSPHEVQKAIEAFAARRA